MIWPAAATTPAHSRHYSTSGSPRARLISPAQHARTLGPVPASCGDWPRVSNSTKSSPGAWAEAEADRARPRRLASRTRAWGCAGGLAGVRRGWRCSSMPDGFRNVRAGPTCIDPGRVSARRDSSGARAGAARPTRAAVGRLDPTPRSAMPKPARGPQRAMKGRIRFVSLMTQPSRRRYPIAGMSVRREFHVRPPASALSGCRAAAGCCRFARAGLPTIHHVNIGSSTSGTGCDYVYATSVGYPTPVRTPRSGSPVRHAGERRTDINGKSNLTLVGLAAGTTCVDCRRLRPGVSKPVAAAARSVRMWRFRAPALQRISSTAAAASRLSRSSSPGRWPFRWWHSLHWRGR